MHLTGTPAGRHRYSTSQGASFKVGDRLRAQPQRKVSSRQAKRLEARVGVRSHGRSGAWDLWAVQVSA
jgi:hypothetical protein